MRKYSKFDENYKLIDLNSLMNSKHKTNDKYLKSSLKGGGRDILGTEE